MLRSEPEWEIGSSYTESLVGSSSVTSHCIRVAAHFGEVDCNARCFRLLNEFVLEIDDTLSTRITIIYDNPI